MDLSAPAAQWFLLAVLPLSLATVWTDLSRMKIPNWVTDALLIAFVPLGLIALPWPDMLWQLTHPAVMLLVGMGLHALRIAGGGDIKFLISASPYVMLGDLSFVVFLLCACLVAGLILHRAARATIGPRIAPNWVSWGKAGQYPMGFSLGPALIIYLGVAATT